MIKYFLLLQKKSKEKNYQLFLDFFQLSFLQNQALFVSLHQLHSSIYSHPKKKKMCFTIYILYIYKNLALKKPKQKVRQK